MAATLIPGGVIKGLNYRSPIDNFDLRLSRRANYLFFIGQDNIDRLQLLAKLRGKILSDSTASKLCEATNSLVLKDFFHHDGSSKGLAQLLDDYAVLETYLSKSELEDYFIPMAVLREVLGIIEQWPPAGATLFPSAGRVPEVAHDGAQPGASSRR